MPFVSHSCQYYLRERERRRWRRRRRRGTGVAKENPPRCLATSFGLCDLTDLEASHLCCSNSAHTDTQTRRAKGRRRRRKSCRDWMACAPLAPGCSHTVRYPILIVSFPVEFTTVGALDRKGFLSLFFLSFESSRGFSCVIVRPRDSQSSFTDTEWSRPSIKMHKLSFFLFSSLFFIYLFIYFSVFQRLVPLFM